MVESSWPFTNYEEFKEMSYRRFQRYGYIYSRLSAIVVVESPFVMERFHIKTGIILNRYAKVAISNYEVLRAVSTLGTL